MKRLLTVLIFFMSVSVAGAFTANWNASYEASPGDGDSISQGAGKIRNFKTDIRERIDVDHYMDEAGTLADHGEHRRVKFQSPITKPTNVANKGFLYIKDVAGKAELHWLDEDNNEVQLTSAGALNQTPAFATGVKAAFFQSACPTGWTQDITAALDGATVRFETGTGGATGGTHDIASPPSLAHTHTGPSHTHTMGTHTHTGPSHTHTMGTHTHTGPSHTHDMSSHTHTGPSHTHTGPSHTHQFYDYNVGTWDEAWTSDGSTQATITQDIGTGQGWWVANSNSTINKDLYTALGGTGNTGTGGTGASGTPSTASTGASGTGVTGLTDPGDTNASGTAATGSTDPGDTNASGTAATGSTTPTAFAPKYATMVMCTKD